MNAEIVGVVGAGIMGSGIAQTCAAAGFAVTLVDVSDIALEKALAGIGNPHASGGRFPVLRTRGFVISSVNQAWLGRVPAMTGWT
ncbi:3-hydroxyacyl-CoA dehydrogenase NAD-binding domain-containing protein [Pseudomonas sp. CR3202]|uniref:3-hydroxyacyl-CoA dehydrogenase NAD-binding domain-containing protein n=1 Tax=Pseudomonas sp. CR3202 TaxID=3351532 RepID=UPI003BEF874D